MKKYANKEMINILPLTFARFRGIKRELKAGSDNEVLETLIDYYIATGGNKR